MGGGQKRPVGIAEDENTHRLRFDAARLRLATMV